jgi:CubicO group peptidase (beta-lactamase class C family)
LPSQITRPSNDQTLFEIGSTTKAFTATLAAMLVTDGKLRWTDRVSDYLPGFSMFDPVANESATLRDALAHQTGIGRAELLWVGSGVTRDEVIHRLRFLKPESPFRSRFSYQNVMYTTAGEAVAKAGGTTWEELVRRRIFEPLGITSTIAARAIDEQERGAAARDGSRRSGSAFI